MKKPPPPKRNLYPFWDCVNWDNLSENDRVILRALAPAEVTYPDVTIEVIPETLDEVADIMKKWLFGKQ